MPQEGQGLDPEAKLANNGGYESMARKGIVSISTSGDMKHVNSFFKKVRQRKFVDKLEKAEGDFNTALQQLLQRLIKKHKRVLFNGDGYSKEWEAEAKKRLLPDLRSTPEALKPIIAPDNMKLFESLGVLSQAETKARYEVGVEGYMRRIHIEGAIAVEMARSMIRPVVADEYSKLATAIARASSDDLRTGLKGLHALALKLGAGLDDLHIKCERLDKALLKDAPAGILDAMAALRKTVDALEYLVDDARWPLPKYREMLFIY